MSLPKGKYGNPIIINADDFGRSPDINAAIVSLLKTNVIQRTTIMMNMPYMQEAYDLVKANNLVNKVGLHINLTDGKPLSKPILETRFCKDGEFDVKEVESHVRLRISKNERFSINCEVQSQFDKYREIFGFYPKHIDGHRHVHNYFGFLPTIVKIAKNCEVESMRIGINLYDEKSAGIIKKLYKCILNSYIKSQFEHTDYMGSYLEYVQFFHGKNNNTVEIMVHPTYHEGKIVDIIYDNDNNQYFDFEKFEINGI